MHRLDRFGFTCSNDHDGIAAFHSMDLPELSLGLGSPIYRFITCPQLSILCVWFSSCQWHLARVLTIWTVIRPRHVKAIPKVVAIRSDFWRYVALLFSILILFNSEPLQLATTGTSQLKDQIELLSLHSRVFWESK